MNTLNIVFIVMFLGILASLIIQIVSDIKDIRIRLDGIDEKTDKNKISNKEFITLGHTPGQKGYTPTQASTTSKPPKGGSGVPPKKK